MRKKPLKICARPGCSKTTKERYCSEHKKHYWSEYDKKRPSRSKRGYDSAWYKFRSAYLENHPLCIFCKADGYLVTATEIDHIKPLSDNPELKYDSGNLRSLCKSCHSKRTWHDQSIGSGKRGQKEKTDNLKTGVWHF